MVRELIGREFGVRLSEPSVGRLLGTLGLSPQRPLDRAYQQNPQAVARGKAEPYPQLRSEAARVGATIYFADEAGGRADDHAGPTWAPVGRTPVVATTGDRFAVNLISAVTAKGKLRFGAYEGNLNGPVVIDFCRRLLQTPRVRCFWSWMATRCTARPPSSSSSPRPAAGCGWSSCPATPQSSTLASGGASTSSTTGSAGPVSAARRTSKQGAGGAAPATTTAAAGAELLPGPEPASHHRLNSPLTYIRLGNSAMWHHNGGTTATRDLRDARVVTGTPPAFGPTHQSGSARSAEASRTHTVPVMPDHPGWQPGQALYEEGPGVKG
jgi:Winged helix-turn helix/DDE superfamily endonuclease